MNEISGSVSTEIDIEYIVNNSLINSLSKISMDNIFYSNKTIINKEDIDIAMKRLKSSQIPNVSWDDIGGLSNIKNDIIDTVQLPLRNPELFRTGMKKRSGNYYDYRSYYIGVLLYGPPGTGKTLIAKAVATTCALNFFSVKGPEILNMYIGESEANIRNIFNKARECSPCVIFFDELDSIAPKRGQFGDSGGVMDRIVSQLLTEIDGLSASSNNDRNLKEEENQTNVFVIGATNRPDLLDTALLRPGRFDKLLYLGVAQDKQTQLKMLEALTRKFNLDKELNLKDVADMCPYNFTGADFYALCSDAMLKAMSRLAEKVEEEALRHNNTATTSDKPSQLVLEEYLEKAEREGNLDIIVGLQDFENAMRELKPSVTEKELEYYKELQSKFSQ